MREPAMSWHQCSALRRQSSSVLHAVWWRWLRRHLQRGLSWAGMTRLLQRYSPCTIQYFADIARANASFVAG
jgi:hypothetical protein